MILSVSSLNTSRSIIRYPIEIVPHSTVEHIRGVYIERNENAQCKLRESSQFGEIEILHFVQDDNRRMKTTIAVQG